MFQTAALLLPPQIGAVPLSPRVAFIGGTLAGVPVVVLAGYGTLCLIRPRWRALAGLAGLPIAAAAIIAAVWLHIDSRTMPAIEHYGRSGWPLCIVLGAFAAGILQSIGWALTRSYRCLENAARVGWAPPTANRLGPVRRAKPSTAPQECRTGITQSDVGWCRTIRRIVRPTVSLGGLGGPRLDQSRLGATRTKASTGASVGPESLGGLGGPRLDQSRLGATLQKRRRAPRSSSSIAPSYAPLCTQRSPGPPPLTPLTNRDICPTGAACRIRATNSEGIELGIAMSRRLSTGGDRQSPAA